MKRGEYNQSWEGGGRVGESQGGGMCRGENGNICHMEDKRGTFFNYVLSC